MKRIPIPNHTDSHGNTFTDCVLVVPETPEDHAKIEADVVIAEAMRRDPERPKRWWEFWK